MNDFLYLQLEQEFSEYIEQGRWQSGERLPSVRQLCQERSISKATVLHAYSRLEARGLVEVRPKAGYFVRAASIERPVPAVGNPESTPKPVTVTDVMRDIMMKSAAFDILPNSDPRVDTPVSIVEMNRSIARALRHQRGLSNQYYDSPEGLELLREQIARRYQRLGAVIGPDQLSITAGCQHALFLALMSCCQPGDVVALESPGFYGALQLAESLRLKVIEIPSRPDTGIDIEGLSSALETCAVKACIVTPAFATPTGSLMPQASRARLLALAEKYDLAIIEDDIYGDLAFGQRPSPLKALDHNNRVILCGSVSKSLSRDLRLGWVSGGRWHDEISRLKLVNMLAVSRFIQQGLSSFIDDGGYDRHLRRQQVKLKEQRDQLADLLDSRWQLPVRFHLPEGGLSLWVELPEGLDTLASYSHVKEQGIIMTPGALFTSQPRYRNCLRLSFAHPWNPQRQKALEQLGDILSQSMA